MIAGVIGADIPACGAAAFLPLARILFIFDRASANTVYQFIVDTLIVHNMIFGKIDFFTA
jgi:hypothetical protein